MATASKPSRLSRWLRKGKGKKDSVNVKKPPTLQPPLKNKCLSVTSLTSTSTYDEILPLNRNKNDNYNVQNLDFAKAQDVGNGLMVPYKKYTHQTKVESTLKEDYQCTCNQNKRIEEELRKKHNKCKVHKIDKPYGPLDFERPNKNSMEPDLLRHVSSSEAETDYGSVSGVSCYCIQDSKSCDQTVRRRSITSTETENYYEFVESRTFTQSDSNKNSSQTVYSSVSINTKSNTALTSVHEKRNLTLGKQGDYELLNRQVSVNVPYVSPTINCDTKKKSFNVDIFDKKSITTVGSSPKMKTVIHCDPDNNASNDTGLIITDSDETYQEVNYSKKVTSKKSKHKIDTSNKRAVTIPRHGKRVRSRQGLDIGDKDVCVKNTQTIPSPIYRPRVKSATYPRLDVSPVSEDSVSRYSNVNYENTSQQGNIKPKNKVLSDLLQRNHDRLMFS